MAPCPPAPLETSPYRGTRDAPWLIPRKRQHSPLIEAAGNMPHRLADYGYEVNTGPLVWNRRRAGLREQPGEGAYPLIWAESIRPDGNFSFGGEQKA